jgi:O-antigen biosynthesis protein
MVRTDLLKKLDGFRDEYAPAYYEDADLCARIAQAGFRVVYDPLVVIHHYEYGSATAVRAVQAQSDRSRRVFVRENSSFLRSRYIADQRTTVFARSVSVERRILFIEDQVPLRAMGSGFVRSNDILTVMASLGFRVTIFPIFGSRLDVAAIYADIPETVEVMYDSSLEDLSEFLDSRDGYYETIWVVRTHNLDRIRPIVERHVVGKGRPPRIILDTEAVASLRNAARADLRGDAFDLETAAANEFQNASFCQNIIAVTETEARFLRTLGFADVSLMGHIRKLAITTRSFVERKGLLFVGAIHEIDSPNYDGLCWLVDDVLPLVEKELGYETRLTIVGYTADGVTLDRGVVQNQRFFGHRGRTEAPVHEGRIRFADGSVGRRPTSPGQARRGWIGPRPSSVNQCGWPWPLINSRGLLPFRSARRLRMKRR